MSSETPAAILFDINGNEISVRDGDNIVASTPAIMLAGSDGADARLIKVATDGTLKIDPTGATTQPVSIASLPLPSGAATETTLASLLTSSTFTGRINTLGQKTMANSTPVVLASDQSTIIINGGTAHDSPDSENPVKIGFKAQSTFPTPVTSGDRVNGIADLWGRQLISHIDPASQITKYFNTTSMQTGADVWTPASGKRIAVTSVVIATYGTTAGRLILWFGDNADTTFTAGTDQVLVAASFAPSASSAPGLVFTPNVPIFCSTADRELHITTDAGLSVDVTIYGYEW